VSSDGLSTPAKLARAAAARDLDAIVLTDHDSFALTEPVKLEGVWLLPGCECSTAAGHILGLFPQKPPNLEALHANGLPSAVDAISMFHDCGAVTVLAHPFHRNGSVSAAMTSADCPVDCVESANARACFRNAKANIQAAELALAFNLPSIGGSDAHSAAEVGNAYTVIDAPDCSLQALREALLEGRCQPVFVKNTPRRYKGFSQFMQACRSRNPGRIIIGIAYVCYCILLDILKRN
jgi:hypothetical protein